jgi:four helix bundle protein
VWWVGSDEWGILSQRSNRDFKEIVAMNQASIASYQGLKVWQEAMNLAEHCYQVTKTFPKPEIYGMVSQVRRAATSIPANIAEGYGRGSLGEYIHFLYVAQGSLKELETHLILCERVELITQQNTESLLHECETVSRLLLGLIRALKRKKDGV